MINGVVDYGIKHFRQQLCLPSHQDCLGSSYSSPCHISGAGTAVTGKLSVRVALPRIFSSSPWCAWLYLAAFSRVIWKQVPPVMLQDCYFHLFLSKERENIQSLFKCAALASGVGVTWKVKQKSLSVSAILCAFWAPIQNKQNFKGQKLIHMLQK